MKKRDEESAFSAICNAQRIACAPFEFEAARSLRDFGILAALDKAGDPGLTDEEIKAVSGLSDYAVRVLLNAAEGAGILKTELRKSKPFQGFRTTQSAYSSTPLKAPES